MGFPKVGHPYLSWILGTIFDRIDSIISVEHLVGRHIPKLGFDVGLAKLQLHGEISYEKEKASNVVFLHIMLSFARQEYA